MATTEYPGHFDATSIITAICASLASYNALELILLILTTFQHYHGLYFWSIVVASSSIIPYVVGMVIMYFGTSSQLAGLVVNNIGWITMIVSQSVVLYSRLGIVLGNHSSRILVFTKWMIVVDAIIFYLLATTTVFGMRYSQNPSFAKGYVYTERLQMTGFCVQEFIISGLYIWKTLDILKAGEKKDARRTLWQLFAINVVIVALDIALLVLEYLGLASVQIAFKPLVYSCKLKMEFAILSKLVESSTFVQRNASTSLSQTITSNPDTKSHVTGPQHFITSALVETDGISDMDTRWKPTQVCSSRNSSHQTDNSEKHLLSSALPMSRPQRSAASSESYHRIVRAI